MVYSGGDDVFLLGAWDHVIEAVLRIRNRFAGFTAGALTLSAGIALFDAHYPIRAAAEETAVLEQRAKSEPGKNAVSLFDAEAEAYLSLGRAFAGQVMEEKLKALSDVLPAGRTSAAWLSSITMTLLAARRAGGQAEPGALRLSAGAGSSRRKSSPTYALYSRLFQVRCTLWACREADRTQLITAIYLYVSICTERWNESHGIRSPARRRTRLWSTGGRL